MGGGGAQGNITENGKKEWLYLYKAVELFEHLKSRVRYSVYAQARSIRLDHEVKVFIRFNHSLK